MKVNHLRYPVSKLSGNVYPLHFYTLPAGESMGYKVMGMTYYRLYIRWLLEWRAYMTAVFPMWDSASGGNC
jgi:hypothetical protein